MKTQKHIVKLAMKKFPKPRNKLMESIKIEVEAMVTKAIQLEMQECLEFVQGWAGYDCAEDLKNSRKEE
jgi:hypothetical protein